MTTQVISDIAEAEKCNSLWKDDWQRLRKNRLEVSWLVMMDSGSIL